MRFQVARLHNFLVAPLALKMLDLQVALQVPFQTVLQRKRSATFIANKGVFASASAEVRDQLRFGRSHLRTCHAHMFTVWPTKKQAKPKPKDIKDEPSAPSLH